MVTQQMAEPLAGAPGPQLPRDAVPRPVVLPSAERWAHRETPTWTCHDLEDQEAMEEGCLEGESALPDETQVFEPRDVVGFSEGESEVKEGTSETDLPARKCCCPCCSCSTACKGEQNFHKLLFELAAEHRRVLENLKLQLEDPHTPAQISNRETSNTDLLGTPSKQETRRASVVPVLTFEERPTEGRLSPFDFVSEDSGAEATGKDEMQARISHYFKWRKDAINRLNCSPSFCVSAEALDGVSSVAIILNSILAGWIANASARNARDGLPPDESELLPYVLTIVFAAWFLVELLIRLWLSGTLKFLTGPDWTWNFFDTAVVLTDCVLCVLQSIPGATAVDGDGGSVRNLTVLRILRVLRISRALRVLRLVRLFRELRMMVFSILHSGSSLLWSLVLMSITMYAFGIYFVQVVSYHQFTVVEQQSGAEEKLYVMFGNMLRAMYTLYQAVSGGIDWGEASTLMAGIHPMHGIVFCSYTFFMTFALVNIITGIFVETSIASARSNQEEVTQDMLDATRVLVEEMKRLFDSADKDRSGTISLDEFEDYLDCKEVRAYLHALGIETDKAKGLFQLLDLDQSGEITIDEFCFGCLRLKGSAKSIDLASLTNQSKRCADQWRRYFVWSEAQFQHLHEFERRLEEHLGLPVDADDISVHAATPLPKVDTCELQGSH